MQQITDFLKELITANLGQMLLALTILVVGWLIALISGMLVRRGLKRTEFDNKLARWLVGGDKEEGIEVARVAAHPAVDLGERLAAATRVDTAAVLTSTVFYSSAHIAGDLLPAAEADIEAALDRFVEETAADNPDGEARRWWAVHLIGLGLIFVPWLRADPASLNADFQARI